MACADDGAARDGPVLISRAASTAAGLKEFVPANGPKQCHTTFWRLDWFHHNLPPALRASAGASSQRAPSQAVDSCLLTAQQYRFAA
jgi:hypothetical protein